MAWAAALAAGGVWAAGEALPPADTVAAFMAAGFKQRGKQWRSPCEDPGTASYTPGRIEQVLDLNGDGLPEAVITEGGSFCYGNTGSGFSLVSKQALGPWKLMAADTGIPIFLNTRGAGGWPDLQIGGPGFCFPVMRWNGKQYVQHRFEYEGKRCKPGRY